MDEKLVILSLLKKEKSKKEEKVSKPGEKHFF